MLSTPVELIDGFEISEVRLDLRECGLNSYISLARALSRSKGIGKVHIHRTSYNTHDWTGPPDPDVSRLFFLFPPAVDGREEIDAALSGGGPTPCGCPIFPPDPETDAAIDPPEPEPAMPVSPASPACP